MKDKILRLCKRLNQFSLNEIVTVTELDQEDVKFILDELVSENKLTEVNGKYRYIRNKHQNKNMPKKPQFFEYHTKETNELILRCFCADIPVLKTALITEPSKTAISNYYAYFRNVLYSLQHKELEQYYKETPIKPSIRALYDKKIYLYNYNGKIFISAEPLKSTKPEIRHTKEELRTSNKAYYKIRRVFQNYAFTQSFAEIAYEKHWLDIHTQDEKFYFLSNLLNITSTNSQNFK